MSKSGGTGTYYALVATQAFSALGSRISGLAIGIWVFRETGAATPLALVAFFAALPMVLGGGLAGALADRFDRRLMMVLADAGQAVGTIALLISFTSGAFEVWHLYIVALLQAAFGAVQGPAFLASITMLAGDAQRDRANALIQMTGPAAGVVAPALAGLLYAMIGVTGAILIDLATFVIAALVVLSLRIPRPAPTQSVARISVWRQAFDGLRYLAARRPLLLSSIYATTVNFVVGVSTILLTPYVLARGASEATLGLVFTALNLGSIAGGLAVSTIGGRRPRIHGMMRGILAASVCLVFAGLAQQAWGVGAAMFFFMACLPFMNAPYMSIMQAKVAPDVQGRVFAALGQLSGLTIPLAYLIAGPLADRVFEPAVATPIWNRFAPLVGDGAGAGMGLMLVLSGVASFAISLIAYALPPIRDIETALPDHTPEEAAPVSGAR